MTPLTRPTRETRAGIVVLVVLVSTLVITLTLVAWM